MSKAVFRQSASCKVERAAQRSLSNFRPAGRFQIQHIRGGQVLATIDVPNGIVDVGLNHILETEFNGGTPITAWYMGLVDNAGFSAFDAADIMSSHAGWDESVAYDEATRPEWTAGTASGRAITNAVTVDFTMNASATIKGLFIVGGTGAATKSATTGTLWSTAAFASTIAVADDDVLKVTYTVSG
jgi:hypothetical protein